MKKLVFFAMFVSLLGGTFLSAQSVSPTQELTVADLEAATSAQAKQRARRAGKSKKARQTKVKKAPQAETPAVAPVVKPETEPTKAEAVKETTEAPAVQVPQETAPVAVAADEPVVAAEEPAQLVSSRETVAEPAPVVAQPKTDDGKIVFNPTSRRDPTLSPDDMLLLAHREKQRLAAIEAERQRRLAEERRRREEAERLRQLELERLKDPTREVRNKIKVGGIIGQEVFIGNKIYTVGKSIYGARIVEVRPEEVVFTYQGHRFVRKVQLN